MKKLKYFLLFVVLIVLGIILLNRFEIFNINGESLKEVFSASTQSIPKVYFEGDISNMLTKEDERKIFLRYKSDENNFEAYTSIKIQGTSSIGYEKKNYTIKLYQDDSYEEKKNVDVGWGEQNKYCLKANWIDKTHARNIVTAQLSAEIQKKYNLFETSPNNGLIDGYPVEIYINNEFLGLYTWNIPKDAWMFNMDEDNEDHIVFVGEGWEDTNYFKSSATYGLWDIEVGRGDEEDLNKFNRLVDFVMNSSDEEFKKNFDQYLNLDTTINYIILMEFAELVDNGGKNMLIATYDGTIWYPTLYDLDTSWGTNYDGLSTRDYKETDFVMYSNLWKRTIDNFPNEIYDRYTELREDVLTKEHVMRLFNDFKSSIPNKTFKKEAKRWDNIPGYDYNQIEEFLDTRIPIVDKFFEDIKNNT